MNSRRKMIGWSAAGLWSSQLVSFVAVLILGRLLGPRAYGVAGYVSIFLSFSQIIFTDGLSVAIFIRPNDKEAPHIVFWLQIILGSIISLAYFIYGCFPIFGVPVPEGADLLRIASIIPLFQAACSVHVDLLRRDMLFSRLAIRSVVSSLVSLAVGVALAALHFGAATIVLMLVAQWLCTFITVWFSHSWRPEISYFTNVGAIRSTVRFGASAIFARLMSFAEVQIPRIAFVTFYNATALGYFNAGFRIMEVLIVVTLYPVSGVASAVFSKHRGDSRALEWELQNLLGLSAVITVPAMLGLGVLSRDIIFVVFGEGWWSAADYVAAVSLFGALLPILMIFSEYTLIVRGAKMRTVLYAAGVGAALVAASAARFVSPAKYAYLVSMQAAIISPIMVVAAVSWKNLGWIIQSYIKPVICACIMAGVVKGVGTFLLSGLAPVSRLSALIGLGVAVYLSVGMVLFPRFYKPLVMEMVVNVRKRFVVTVP